MQCFSYDFAIGCALVPLLFPPSSESLQPRSPPAISMSILATKEFDLEWGWPPRVGAGEAGSQYDDVKGVPGMLSVLRLVDETLKRFLVTAS